MSPPKSLYKSAVLFPQKGLVLMDTLSIEFLGWTEAADLWKEQTPVTGRSISSIFVITKS